MTSVYDPQEEVFIIRIAIADPSFSLDHVVDAFKLTGSDVVLLLVAEAIYALWLTKAKKISGRKILVCRMFIKVYVSVYYLLRLFYRFLQK